MSLNLYQNEDYFFIKNTDFIDNGEQTLIIDRNKHQIFEVTDNELFNSVNKLNEGQIFGIVGIMNIIGHNYLCVIREAEDLGTLLNAHLYKITQVKIYPFQINIIHQVNQYIDELSKYLSEGFYFSYGYDLTCSRQRRIKFLSEKNKDPLRVIAADHRYFWNINLYNVFKEQNIDSKWFTPLIQGYIGNVWGKLNGEELQMVLISRRQHSRGGTRYNARGVDDQGNAANFVETEQIIKKDNLIFSYVIIRGSVPVFWEQKGMLEGVTLTRGPEMTKRAFHNHFQDLQNTYGQIFVVDLLSDKKKREIILTKEYVRQLYDSEFKDTVKFLHFDFHHYCSGDKYQSLKVLMGKLGEGLHDFSFFMEDQASRKILRFQQGVFRVNCLDSLDRTNVGQSKIGFMVLQKVLIKLGYDIEQTLGPECQKHGIAFADVKKPLVQRFKHFWAEQGDQLSKQYAGTTSTISKVSRDGKEGFMGKISHKMKNVQRYFINTISENFQQNSIDIILGRHARSIITTEFKSYMISELKRREDLYTEVDSMKLFVGSWNIGGVKPYENFDMSSWLLPFKENFFPDIIVLGFQEIIELNTKSILMGNNQQMIKYWNDLIIDTLRKHTNQEYVPVQSEDLVGCHIGLFTKKGINHKITDIATSKVKLGFSGKMGNKGATLIRFLIEDTSFCFINCHLESGHNIIDAKRRIQQVNEIFQTAFIKDRGTQQINYQVANHDVKILFGDLNFRINIENKDCRKLIQIQDYDELYKNDEFQYAQQDSGILRNFKEGHIVFDPTYKYDTNSNVYDTSSKARVPAWTDRIIFDDFNNLTQVYYGRAELKISDHRPIFSLFEAKIRKINEVAKIEIEEKIVSKFRTLNPSLPPKIQTSPLKELKERSKSFCGIEPSIGDFGLLETVENGSRSPQIEYRKSVFSDNPMLLDQIIQSKSVLLDQAEQKNLEENVYVQVLNEKNSESDNSSPQQEFQQLKQLFQQKQEKKVEVITKKVEIFNNDSDENDESPLKFVQGKLKGLHINTEDEAVKQFKKDLFEDDDQDLDNEIEK